MWMKVLCWIWGHLPLIEADIEDIIRCARCGAPLAKIGVTDDDKTPPAAPPSSSPPVTGA